MALSTGPAGDAGNPDCLKQPNPACATLLHFQVTASKSVTITANAKAEILTMTIELQAPSDPYLPLRYGQEKIQTFLNGIACLFTGRTRRVGLRQRGSIYEIHGMVQ